MPAPHPRMHGITHVAGGPDPVPGLLPAGGNFDGIVRAIPDLYGYWRLGETAAPWADTSGETPAADLHESGTGAALTTHVTGALPAGQDDGALQFNYDGTTSGGGRFVAYTGAKSFSLAEMTAAAWAKTGGSLLVRRGDVIGNMNWSSVGAGYLYGWALQIIYPTLAIRFTRGQPAGPATDELYVETVGGVTAGEWNLLVGSYDGTTIRLYVNAQLVGETEDTGGGPVGDSPILLGYGGESATNFSWFYGAVDEAAVWTRALTQDEINRLYGGGTSVPGTGGGIAGDVLTLGDDGQPAWDPPTVEVEHGDVQLDETPQSKPSDPYAGGPTDPGGFLTELHVETVVLYDGNPARFTVPPREWVRVPFDTVRIWRRWEPTVGSPDFKEAWLPDDRGLTEQAKKGILHVTEAMAGDQGVSAWFSIEWQVLDFNELPNYEGGAVSGFDSYVRAGRILNLSDGQVMRASPGSGLRRFFEWIMNLPAAGITVFVDYPDDNPYPIYPDWPDRPLRLTDPYPKLSPTESANYYGAGNGPSMTATLAAGDNLCLQAWQDAPWPLRFSTDNFKDILAYVPAYLRRPFLSVSFSYDPATVDHATGKLL